MMDETQQRLADMTRTVGEGAFEIAYQPICELATGKISHYEALARFDRQQGTGETVKFIEALGIANALDLAVASKVMNVVEQTATRMSPSTSPATPSPTPPASACWPACWPSAASWRRALLIEITETAAIADLEARRQGDRGAARHGLSRGAGRFRRRRRLVNYLHAFQVDFVKFDGAMIQKIGTSPRDDALLAGLAKLCGEMGVTTIAEWIESEAMAKAAPGDGLRLTARAGSWGRRCWRFPPSRRSASAKAVRRKAGAEERLPNCGFRTTWHKNSHCPQQFIIILPGGEFS